MAEDDLLSTFYPTCWDYKLTLPCLPAVFKDFIHESPKRMLKTLQYLQNGWVRTPGSLLHYNFSYTERLWKLTPACSRLQCIQGKTLLCKQALCGVTSPCLALWEPAFSTNCLANPSAWETGRWISTGARMCSDPEPHFQSIVDELSSCSLLGFVFLCPGSALTRYKLPVAAVEYCCLRWWQVMTNTISKYVEGKLRECGVHIELWWVLTCFWSFRKTIHEYPRKKDLRSI